MNLKTVKAIIFDFDGVIADTVADIAGAVNKTIVVVEAHIHGARRIAACHVDF